MIPVQRVLPAVLSEVLRKAPLTPEKVAFAWRAVVGPALDQATTIELRDRVLHVRAKGGPWAREVERSAATIRQRLAAYLGEGVVGYIQVAAEEEPASLGGNTDSERG
jgi:predicted nucleic acid-binding Zn ribbon protein